MAKGLSVSFGATQAAQSVERRLGHVDQLGELDTLDSQIARRVQIRSFAGMRIDMHRGLPTCG